MIRERGSTAYRRASAGFHAGLLLVAVWSGPWLAALAGWLLARAWWLPGHRLAPRQVDLIEIGNCLLLLAAIWLTWS